MSHEKPASTLLGRIMADDKRPIIDRESLVPLGSSVAAVAAILGLHLWLTARFSELQTSIDSIDRRIEKVEGVAADRWTASDQKIFELESRRLNPTINYPDSYDIIERKKQRPPGT